MDRSITSLWSKTRDPIERVFNSVGHINVGYIFKPDTKWELKASENMIRDLNVNKATRTNWSDHEFM